MMNPRLAWVLALAVVVGACASESKLGPNAGDAAFGEAPTNTAGNRLVEFEQFEICKDFAGPVDNPGPVRFNVTVDIDNNNSVDETFSVYLDNGECREIWLNGGQGFDLVTVTEVVPSGFTASYVMTRLERSQLGGGSDQVVVGSPVASNSASRAFAGNVIGTVGVLVEFTNTRRGAEGCTPGFWKNHTGLGPQANEWVKYSQGASYDATFGVTSSFGGTLLDALNRGGGGEAALGRHAVAALLNAASSVNYWYTEAEVIAIVQNAYTTGGFEAAKNLLEFRNATVCPLPRTD